jgi:Leucine-rich repeat (LRR) protein
MPQDLEVSLMEIRLAWSVDNIKFNSLHSESFLHCSHNFSGPFNLNLRINQTQSNDSTNKQLKIDFKPSPHIFFGIYESFKKLERLHIAHQTIKTIERRNFAGLTDLEELALNNNYIEFLPENSFWDLTKLKELDISNNQIKNLQPNVFSKLVNIKEIWSYNNPGRMLRNVDFSKIPSVRLYNETSNEYVQQKT